MATESSQGFYECQREILSLGQRSLVLGLQVSVWQPGSLGFAPEMIWDSSLLPVIGMTRIIFVYM